VVDVQHFLLAVAATPWALLVMAALLIVDGFFPFVPGETAVVTLAAFAATGHGPAVWLILFVAIAATMAGDGIAFTIGRRVGLTRWRWMRRPRVVSAVEWASRGVLRRPAMFLVAAKFVPFVRVVVTMTAGAGRLSVRRYLPISFAASTIYTGYHVAVAVLAGSTFSNPLVGAGVAIVVAIILGLLFEVISTRLRRRAK
jgi:membrane-associated protein